MPETLETLATLYNSSSQMVEMVMLTNDPVPGKEYVHFMQNPWPVPDPMTFELLWIGPVSHCGFKTQRFSTALYTSWMLGIFC